jgi:hypothetical protein
MQSTKSRRADTDFERSKQKDQSPDHTDTDYGCLKTALPQASQSRQSMDLPKPVGIGQSP